MAETANFDDGKPNADLRTLVWAAQHGTITDADFSRLDGRLQSDSEFRRQYLHYLRMIAELQFDVAFQPEASLPIEHALPALRQKLNLSRFVAIAASVLLVGYFFSLAGLVIWDKYHPRDLQQDFVAQS